MPSTRIYTLRGQQPAAQGHVKIQLSEFEPTHQYAIREFRVYPANLQVSSHIGGTITMGKNDGLDPMTPDFGNQNELAWAQYSVRQPIPPGIGESFLSYETHLADIKLFAYDVWLHTEDSLGNSDVNWYMEIERYTTSKEAGSISSLQQHLVNTS
jgi:hypothetical protein